MSLSIKTALFHILKCEVEQAVLDKDQYVTGKGRNPKRIMGGGGGIMCVFLTAAAATHNRATPKKAGGGGGPKLFFFCSAIWVDNF